MFSSKIGSLLKSVMLLLSGRSLCVYIQLAPLKSPKARDLIEAVRQTIICPFAIPKYIRSNSKTAMFNYNEFFSFIDPLGITFLPSSNGAAERAVQTIKFGAKEIVKQGNHN